MSRKDKEVVSGSSSFGFLAVLRSGSQTVGVDVGVVHAHGTLECHEFQFRAFPESVPESGAAADPETFWQCISLCGLALGGPVWCFVARRSQSGSSG